MIYSKIILDTRKKGHTGIFPIKMRITCNRIQKYYLTGFQMSEVDFRDCMKNPPSKKFREVRIQLDHLDLKARQIILSLDQFSFKQFEEKFYAKRNQEVTNIRNLFESVIKEKLKNGNVSTAINYRCSINSLAKFAPRLNFSDITPEFLKNYESYLVSGGKSISTVGIYLRPLRAILNEAIGNKLIPLENYPFGKRKYVIPISRNIKKALTRDDFKKIVEYTSSAPLGFEARSKDFWLLSYLCQGMNPKDILLLKTSDIEDDVITFTREKTKNSTRAGQVKITVPLLPEAKNIIDRWKTADNHPFVFGIVKKDMDAMGIYKSVQQFVKMTNKHMNIIAEKLGIEKRITCYTARYQFTKAMIDADVSLEFIRQCLGHQNPITTQRYIGSFENIKKFEIAKKHLLNF